MTIKAQGFYIGGKPVSDTNRPTIDLMADGVHSILMDNLLYVDSKGNEHWARKILATDGKSVPPLLWPIFGSPWTGKNRLAGIIHDQECEDLMKLPKLQRGKVRSAADENWYEMCRYLGDGKFVGGCLWIGVRIGWHCWARWFEPKSKINPLGTDGILKLA